MIRAFLFSKNEYEKIPEVDNDEKYSNLSPYFEAEKDNTIDMSEESLQLENEHRIRMIPVPIQCHKTEQFKTFMAFLMLNVSFLGTSISLALTHDRVPFNQPLPDIFLNNVESIDNLLKISEIQIMVAVNTCILILFFHKHRLLIAKRCFFMLSILYIYRSISFFVTVLPISSTTYYCSPRSNATTTEDIFRRVLSIYTGFGLSLDKPQTFCGDSIFSGHATMLVFSYLIIKEYTPNKLKFLQILVMLNAIVGILFLLVSHSHYSIDCIIAYYITTRLFWTYHQLCLSTHPSNKTHITKEWWMFLFNYFENHSIRTVANEFQIPWPLNVKFSINKF